jgi:hypothetical protein
MIKKIFFLLVFCFLRSYLHAQDTATHMLPPDVRSGHLRISLLTCSPGHEEVYEVFGHTAVRIIDSTAHTDLVYNYGTFEYGADFEVKFMRGKVLYCLSIDPFLSFMQEYVEAKRSVEEQVLNLDDTGRYNMAAFLEWNAAPANKYYQYDFFFDNCATRIRDIFKQRDITGPDFHFAEVLPKGEKLSFRDIINRYFYSEHWTRVGVNLLLGSKIDRRMSNEDIMFLPDYLRDGVGGATARGVKIAAPPVVILPGGAQPPAGLDEPLLLTLLIAILTIAGLTVKRLRILGRVMSALLLFVTGLLGCIMLFMWIGTDHQACGDNYNLLWCLPTNIIIAFFNSKGKSRYAIIGILFIFFTLLLHILKIQMLTLPELAPLLLALLWVYGAMYKKGSIKHTAANA